MDNKNRVFESGAVRDDNAKKPLTTALDGYTRKRFGYHMRKGALKHGENNWRAGFTLEAEVESLDRHMADLMDELRTKGLHGLTEDHCSAIIFNTQLIMLRQQREGVEADHWFK